MSQAKKQLQQETTASAKVKISSPTKKSPVNVLPIGSVTPHSFPLSVSSSEQLSPLADKHSSYAAVARTCLHLNQQIAHQGNVICHDANYAKAASARFAALIECIQSHDDRRCRILACKTLATVARSAYGRLCHSPSLFAIREGTLHHLEDEVGTDVPVALCRVALEDVDDGVAACAVEALGVLTLSSDGDELIQEMEALAHARPSPLAATLLPLVDDDPSVPQLELQVRVYENVLSPRLWRLLQRIQHMSQPHQERTLPFITDCLVHLVQNTTCFGVDRTTYAKRWTEIDSLAMVQDVVERILVPSMQQQSGDGTLGAALSALRLAHACPSAMWVLQACQWAVQVLSERLQTAPESMTLADRMLSCAALLIALRAVPLPDRIRSLAVVVNKVTSLPSTTRAPKGVVSAGIRDKATGSYRRPARIGYLTDLALSFFVDDPVSVEKHVRTKTLSSFLMSPHVTEILAARSRNSTGDLYLGTHVGEELVLAFCRVATEVGRRVFLPLGRSLENLQHVEQWLRSSVATLGALSACLNWMSRSHTKVDEADNDEKSSCTMLMSAQLSYLQLLLECAYVAAALSPKSSVSLVLLPRTFRSGLLIHEEFARASSSLHAFESVHGLNFAWRDLKRLSDKLLTDAVSNTIPSRQIRISVLATLTDLWVANCLQATRDSSPPTEKNLNDSTARQLLMNFSDEISRLGSDKCHSSHDYMVVCVACVENMALSALSWGRKLSVKKEDSALIVQVAVEALKGGGAGDSENMEGDLSLCDEARRRIQYSVAYALDSRSHGGGGSRDSLSVLLKSHGASRRVTDRLLLQSFDETNDSSGIAEMMTPILHDAHFAYYSRQVLLARTIVSINHSPLASFALSPGIRPRSIQSCGRLRLSASSVPSLRESYGDAPVSLTSPVCVVSGGSDPVAVLVTHAVRRALRYDCEPEYKVTVTIRAANTTAVEIEKGVRLGISIKRQTSESSKAFTSLSSVYKHVIKASESVTWDVELDSTWLTGKVILTPSLTFRDIEDEHPTGRVVSTDQKDENDDDTWKNTSREERMSDRTLSLNVVPLSPLTMFQPSPLIFFRGQAGDELIFGSLWAMLPFRLRPIELMKEALGPSQVKDAMGQVLSRLSRLSLPVYGEDDAVEGWAFSSLGGHTVLCVIAPRGEAGVEARPVLYCRSDDADLMLSSFSVSSNDDIVRCLTRGLWKCQKQEVSLSLT